MPIMDGYEACQKIIQFYNMVISDINMSKEWKAKANQRHQENREILALIKEHCSIIQEMQMHPNENAENRVVFELLQMLQDARYRFLDEVKRPIICAYSSLVTKEVEKKTKDHGFDKCLEAPLNQERFKIEMLPMLESLSQKYWRMHLTIDQVSIIETIKQYDALGPIEEEQ